MDELRALTERGLEYLASSQQPNGSFLSISSKNPDGLESPKVYKTTFFASLISLCLKDVPGSKAIRAGISKFLLSQKGIGSSFNYWQRESEEYKTLPYPDDLDDTFLALAALKTDNPESISGADLAQIISMLIHSEVQPGGPYYTWLTESTLPEWRDADLAVNANVGFYLNLEHIVLPGLQNFVQAKIISSDYYSQYYSTDYAVIYFVSRYLPDPRIADYLKQRKIGNNWGGVLETVLAVNALLNLGDVEVDDSIAYLKENFDAIPGLFKGFCVDPKLNGETYYASSPELTTALFLEAFEKFSESKKPKSNLDIAADFKNKILSAAHRDFQLLPTVLKSVAEEALSKASQREIDLEISALPYQLNSESREKLNAEIIFSLGMLNFYGCIAYRIYDDFYDGEANPSDLAVANYCLREITLISESFGNQNFSDLFRDALNKMENASLWELRYACKKVKNGIVELDFVPDYSNNSVLAEKSFGYVLGAAGLLIFRGFGENSSDFKNLMDFFWNYSIARQLNDDAHDWYQDLQKGLINPVSAKLLKWHSGNVDLRLEKEKLQKQFWENVVVEVANEILERLSVAETALMNIISFEDKTPLLWLLEGPRKGAEEALRENKRTNDFLKAYGS